MILHFTDKETDSKEPKWFARGHMAKCRDGSQTHIAASKAGAINLRGGDSSPELVLPPGDKAESCRLHPGFPA